MHFTVNYISKVCKKKEKVIVIPFTLVGTKARAIAKNSCPLQKTVDHRLLLRKAAGP